MATRTTRKTSASTTRRTKAAPKIVAVASAPKAATAPEAEAETLPVEVKMKELVDRVTTVTGAKRSQVKPVVDATLAQIGAALDEGKSLNLPGLGKARIAKVVNRMLTVKLRRPAPKQDAPEETPEETAAE